MTQSVQDRLEFAIALAVKACALAGLRLSVPFHLPSVRAEQRKDEPYPGPYYVVFNASGGWDTTYLMDPKGVHGINRLFREGDILTKGAHKFAPIKQHAKGGMPNEDFYAELGGELLTLNGLDYSVNNHAPGARYMATGKLDSLAYPTFAALVAACRGPECPLAYLTFGNYSATGNLVAMSRIPYLPSLKKIANADAIDGNERSPYQDKFVIDRIETTLPMLRTLVREKDIIDGTYHIHWLEEFLERGGLGDGA